MSARFAIHQTPIAGLAVLERRTMGDARGMLERLYCAEELSDLLGGVAAQVNRTVTAAAGTVRGMHFQQPPHAEDKVIACIRGEVFDVAVDLRCGSPTFLRWHGEVLSPGNRRSMLVPRGFAHGFQALADGSEMIYVHTAPFRPDAEGGLDALDPRLGIDWPLEVRERSARDATHPPLDEAFGGLDP
jgi:dTDP-4-dehydrorhamnose 3,5-epimerase